MSAPIADKLTEDEALERTWAERFEPRTAITKLEVLAVKYYNGKPFGFLYVSSDGRHMFSESVGSLQDVKPKPQYRHWMPGEVPVGSTVRNKKSHANVARVLIQGVRSDGLVSIYGIGTWISTAHLLEDYELVKVVGDEIHTSPCGVAK